MSLLLTKQIMLPTIVRATSIAKRAQPPNRITRYLALHHSGTSHSEIRLSVTWHKIIQMHHSSPHQHMLFKAYDCDYYSFMCRFKDFSSHYISNFSGQRWRIAAPLIMSRNISYLVLWMILCIHNCRLLRRELWFLDVTYEFQIIPVVTRFEPIWIQDCFVSSLNVGWAYVPWMVLYVTSKKGEYGELKWVSPYLLNIPDLDCCELMQVLTDEKVVERSSGEYTKVPGLGDGRNDEL